MIATTPAPNFVGTFPGAGERIGPAWQVAWNILSHGEWVTSGELAVAMRDKARIEECTAKSLLRGARKAGILAVKRRIIDGKRRAVYRIADQRETPTHGHATSLEWIVVGQRIVTTDNDSIAAVYLWDGKRFASREQAVGAGFRAFGCDDFSIGQVRGKRLAWFGWMDESKEADRAEVARQLQLDVEEK